MHVGAGRPNLKMSAFQAESGAEVNLRMNEGHCWEGERRSQGNVSFLATRRDF